MGGTELWDEQMVRTLYAEHAAPLLAFVQRLVSGDRAMAEDLVQETLLRAWRHSDELIAEDVRRWLFTTARHLVVDGYRARSARPREAPAEAPDALGADPADHIDEALTAAVVTDALRTLTSAHRAVLIDYFYRGRTAAEIAEERGLSAGTARSRLFYAMRALRLALQERGVNGP